MQRRDFLKISAVTASFLFGQNSLFGQLFQNQTYLENIYTNEYKFIYGDFLNHGVYKEEEVSWDVWANKGVVFREKAISANGYCGNNRRACYSQAMYEKDRIIYPLKRVGNRGEGEWERISWEKAINEIATDIFRYVNNGDIQNIQINLGGGLNKKPYRELPILKFADKFGIAIDRDRFGFSGYRTVYDRDIKKVDYKELLNSDTIIFWASNPLVTDMKNAHSILDMRYKGYKIVVISPELNAMARVADIWIPIKKGTDDILAKNILYEIIKKGQFDKEYILKNTNLAFLIDKRTKKFLTSNEEFYVWDSLNNRIDIDSKKPVLDGVWEIEFNGKRLEVTTAFKQFCDELEDFNPEITQKYTNLNPNLVKLLSKGIQESKNFSIVLGANIAKSSKEEEIIRNISAISAFFGFDGENIRYSSSAILENKNIEKYSIQKRKFPSLLLMVGDSKYRKDKQRDEFLSKVEKIIYMDTRFNYTAQFADIVLPIKGDYEIDENFYGISSPKDMKYIGESKDEKEIFLLIQNRLEEIISKNEENSNNLSDLYENFEDNETIVKEILDINKSKKQIVYIESNFENRGFNFQNRATQKFPYNLIVPRARYSTNSTHKANKVLLRLQRGEPIIIINPIKAEKKRIKDGNIVKIFNQFGYFLAKVKISSSVSEDSLMIDYGWEPYMFIEGRDLVNIFPNSADSKYYIENLFVNLEVYNG